MRRVLIISLLLVIAGTGAATWIGLRNRGPHYSAERREWADRAIETIGRESSYPTASGAKDSDAEWLTADTIACVDGSWLAYRSQCHKQDPKIHDIFIAKASNGQWYYSDYHFCIDALVLRQGGQPETLEKFKARYALAEFDGTPDAALAPTWQKDR